MEKVIVYSLGIVSLSACADNSLSIEEIEQEVNQQHPTGISSQWTISQDKHFHQGNTNPCPCDQYPETRKHYLLNC